MFTELIDEQEAEDMVSLTKQETGIANTIFVSPRGYAQHAARLKIAIAPPDTFDTTTKAASMALHDYSVTGERVPPHLARQAERFIELNRAVLLAYWNNQIGTAELLRRILPI